MPPFFCLLLKHELTIAALESHHKNMYRDVSAIIAGRGPTKILKFCQRKFCVGNSTYLTFADDRIIAQT